MLLQLAQKVGIENEIMNYHSALRNSVEVQLLMAFLHYLKSHFERTTKIYNKVLIENKDFHGINIYIGLRYYKVVYYDVSLDILAFYPCFYPCSVNDLILKQRNLY